MNSKAICLVLVLIGVAALACGCGSKGDRCRKCGMLVDQHPRWIAGLSNPAGKEERFCCERCMLVHLRSPQGAGSRDAWVTEYYSQKRMPIGDVLFVMGSDVTGPMGKALVPIAGRTAAEQFLQDHHGQRILAAGEITAEVLREVAGKSTGLPQ
jgi:copper chaperone NosL